MPAPNTRERSEALQVAARAFIAARGLDVTVHSVPRAWAAEFATAQACHLDTAKRHLARAARVLRGEASAQWGGTRPGAGRPKKGTEMNPKHIALNGTEAHARITAGVTAHPRVTLVPATLNGPEAFLIDGAPATHEEVRALVFGPDYVPPPEWPEADRWGLLEEYGKGYAWRMDDGRCLYAREDAALGEAVRRWKARGRQCLYCRLGLPDIHAATRAARAVRGL